MKNLINVSIDDVSPHPLSSTKVLKRCFELITVFPEIKFSLFVPIAYWRTIKPQTATRQPLFLNKFPEFCKIIKDLPDKNFEICYHGFYHGIPFRSDNDEFQNLSYNEAIEKINLMESVIKDAGLYNKFKKIFRPPAWRMSSHSIKAFRDRNFEILALSPNDYATKTYDREHLKVNDIVFYNCNPPFIPLSLYEKTEIVYHACEWDKNYLDISKTNDLKNFINKNKNNYKFCFLKDLK
jgi:hypothetical protein